MIRTGNIRKNASIRDTLSERLVNEEIVESPADVSIARPRLHVPPRVISVPVVKEPERIKEAALQDSVDPLALDRQESGDAGILLGASEIVFRNRKSVV